MSKVYNFTDIILQKQSYTTKYGTAGQTNLIYIGPKQNILNAYNTYYLAGWQVNTFNNQEGGDNPVWTLNVTYQADLSQGTQPASVTQPEPVWEVGSVAVQQSIFEIDRPIIKNLSADTKEKIEKALKNPSQNLPLTSGDNYSTEGTNAAKVYALAQIGVEGKTIYAKQVKRTITVPNKFVTNWTPVNEGKVFNKSDLIATYNIPNWIVNLLPQNSPELTSIDNKTNATLYAQYGYLEGDTKYSSVGSNMVQASTEWTYGRYPIDLI